MREFEAGLHARGYTTQNAGTVITRLIPARRGLHTLLKYVKVRTSTTEHTLTVMPARGWTTVSAAAAASQAVFTVYGNPGDYTGLQIADNLAAANDYYCIRLSDGTFHFDTLNAVSSLSFTGNTNLPIALAGGEKVWLFGISTDLDPFTSLAFEAYKLEASSTNTFGSESGDEHWFATVMRDWPVMLYIDNAVAASKLDQTVAGYARRGGHILKRMDGVGVP